MALLAGVAEAFAQSPEECSHLNAHEIAVEMYDDDIEGIFLNIYDASGGSEASFALTHNAAGCDWYGELHWDSTGADWIADDNSLLYIFEFARAAPGATKNTQPIARFAYLYILADNGVYENDFYSPPLFLPSISPDMGFGLYLEGGQVVVRSFPDRPHNNPLASYETEFAADYFVVPLESKPGLSPPSVFLAPLDPSGPLPDLDANPTYTVSGYDDVEIESAWDFVWDVDNLTLKFPEDTRLVVEGELDADDVTFTEANTQGWGGIAVMGEFTADDVTVEYADVGVAVTETGTAEVDVSAFRYNDTGFVVEGDLSLLSSTVEAGEVGVVVYEPGTATLTTSTLRVNSVVGLDVLSAAGTTVAGSTIEQNGRGVRTGIPQDGPGGPVYCFGPCRSTLAIQPSPAGGLSFIQNNVHAGVEALDADVQIEETFIWNNGDTGLRVSNATVLPFLNNCVQSNGYTYNSPGTSALPGGDFYVSPTNQPGNNRIADNQMAELAVLDGGYALVGDPTGDTGNNAIFDVGSSQPLITNGNKADVEAYYAWWGSSSGPPANAFDPVGSVDFFPYVLASDPTVNICDVLRQGLPSRSLQTASVAKAEGDVPLRGEGLGEAIRAIRQAIAAAPGADSAAVLVERLHNLHRRDRGNGLGEWAATAALLGTLRANLAEPDLPEGLRATAEAALEVEALHALTHGQHEEAGSLLAAWGEAVESPEVSGVLRMVEAHLAAAGGAYGAASSLVAAAAEGEADEVARRELLAVAALYAERSDEPGEGRGVPGAAVSPVARGASTGRADASELSVYPNPSRDRVTVALSLVEASEVRVAVYDVLGREVALLADGTYEAGQHRFSLDGARLPAGVYLVRTESGERRMTERITLVR